MTDYNVVVLSEALADTLPEIAKAVRVALDDYAKADEEWVEAALALIKELKRGRDKVGGSDRNFGGWLGENGLDDLGHQDRAAAINLGQDFDLAREVLTETKSRSLRLIWEANQGKYNDLSSFTNTGKVENKEKPAAAAEDATKTPDLVKKFGEKVGRPIYNYFGRNTRTGKRIKDKLNKTQAATLSAFLSANAGKLPQPNNSDDRLGLRTIWREAPQPLCRPYTIGNSEGGSLMQVLTDWPDKLARHYAAWLADGKPDAARWWGRNAPLPTAAKPAAVVGTSEVATVTVISDHVAAISERIRKDAEAAATAKPDQSCRPSHQGPIRHHGVDVWPGKNPSYSFLEAWYAITIWRTIDAGLKSDNPRTRAAGFLKLLVGCMSNLNAAAAAALWVILNAQSAYPDKTGRDDNECPPYDSIQ